MRSRLYDGAHAGQSEGDVGFTMSLTNTNLLAVFGAGRRMYNCTRLTLDTS